MEQYGFWQIAGMSALITALCFFPITWRLFLTHFITLVHECGHAFIGVFSGGFIRNIKIRMNSSGETITARQKRIFPVGGIVTLMSGYPFPILLGALMLASVNENWQPAVFTGLFVMGIACMLFIRNFFGLLVTAAWIWIFGYYTLVSPPSASVFLTWAGLFLFIGGIRDMISLFRMLVTGFSEGSDLDIGAESFYLPRSVSYFLMAVIAGGGSWLIFSL